MGSFDCRTHSCSDVSKNFNTFNSSKRPIKNPKCVNVSPFMSAKLASKWATHVGNYIVLNMDFNPTVQCLRTKPLLTILLALFSPKLGLASTCQGQFLSIWNRLLLTK